MTCHNPVWALVCIHFIHDSHDRGLCVCYVCTLTIDIVIVFIFILYTAAVIRCSKLMIMQYLHTRQTKPFLGARTPLVSRPSLTHAYQHRLSIYHMTQQLLCFACKPDKQ